MKRDLKANTFRKVVLSNDSFFIEVVSILSKGGTVTIPVKGSSMLPFIVGGRDKVVLEKKQNVRRGDIVLALINEKDYVLHRVYDIQGNILILMGDGNCSVYERCLFNSVCGTVNIIVRDGKNVYVNRKSERLKAKIWKMLLPFRPYLLSFLRFCRML